MRYFEISSGFRMPISEEEQALLAKGDDHKSIRADDLAEREGEVARLMVNRGLLDRHRDDKGMFYTVNDCADLWRF